MITFEFGMAETQNLDKYSIFIKFRGDNFHDNIAKIKSYKL